MSPNTNTNTRWCPTPEQLMILEELYRRGLKTPNATQIQRITGHLSMYGKIQGKNVFYWFQNHKARDRQKLRKKLAKQLHHHHLLHASAQTHFTYFPHQQYFPLNFLHAQQHEGTTTAAPEMGPGVMSWRAADLLIPAASYNGHGPFLHEYAMATDAGPASSCVTGNSTSSKPIQTLELFPLRSTKEEDDV